MLKKPTFFIPIITGVLAFAACRTTEKRPASPISAPPKLKEAELGLNEPQRYLSLSKEDSQSTYLSMLKIEMDGGGQVPSGKQHTTRGVVECKHMGSLQNCILRVTLPGDESAQAQPLDPKLAARAISFALDYRPELKDEGVIFTNLICDYVGKKSPPFQLEDVRCYFDQPRSPSEAVFDGKIAEELGEAIRGDTTYGTNIVQLNGALFCHWLEASRRSICVTRTNINGVLQESVVELGPATSYTVAKGLRQAVVDRSHMGSLVATSAASSTDSKASIPSELMSTLACIVDNTRIEIDGQRTYMCRARI